MEVSLASSVHGTDARLVAWSLGNFVSFQRTLPRERSCVLAVEVEKTDEDEGARLVRVSVAPTRVALVPSGTLFLGQAINAAPNQLTVITLVSLNNARLYKMLLCVQQQEHRKSSIHKGR